MSALLAPPGVDHPDYVASAAAQRASELRALREQTAAQTRAKRLAAAVDALTALGWPRMAARLAHAVGTAAQVDVLDTSRTMVQEERESLADGSDESRYAATGAALEALGALWAVST